MAGRIRAAVGVEKEIRGNMRSVFKAGIVALGVSVATTTFTGVMAFPLSALAAAGDFPEGVKRAYVDRCGGSMHSQGLPLDKARGYCRCIIDAQEIEFGKREYDAMMKAQPNPSGSDIQQRLYKVFTGCSHWLPQ